MKLFHCRPLRHRQICFMLLCILLCASLIFYMKSNRKNEKIFIAVVEEHHEVLPYWLDGVTDGFIPRERITVIHIDGHSDDAPPEYIPEMPFFHWPKNDLNYDSMLQKNDIFIQMAAMVGFLGRFIWLFPNWIDDDKYLNETVQQGYFMRRLKDPTELEPYFCECRTEHSPNQEEKKCSYLNYTLMDTEPEMEISEEKCIIKETYMSETIHEDFALKSINPHSKESGREIWLGRQMWIAENEPVIWDIDLDYFGCELPGDLLVEAGMSWRVVELIDRKLDRLFCPSKIEHEPHTDIILKHLINDMVNSCTFNSKDKCSESFANILTITEQKITIYWRNFPQLFCPRNDANVRAVWKDVIYILYHLTFKQLQALQSVGFCFNFSPKTFGAQRLMAVHVCHGANPPDSKYVQKYSPSLEDINERLERLERIMSLLPAPLLVTICRSARDGYVPRQYVKLIEDGVIKAIRRTHKLQKFEVLYDRELLAGEDGWPARLDLGNEATKVKKWI